MKKLLKTKVQTLFYLFAMLRVEILMFTTFLKACGFAWFGGLVGFFWVAVGLVCLRRCFFWGLRCVNLFAHQRRLPSCHAQNKHEKLHVLRSQKRSRFKFEFWDHFPVTHCLATPLFDLATVAENGPAPEPYKAHACTTKNRHAKRGHFVVPPFFLFLPAPSSLLLHPPFRLPSSSFPQPSRPAQLAQSDDPANRATESRKFRKKFSSIEKNLDFSIQKHNQK